MRSARRTEPYMGAANGSNCYSVEAREVPGQRRELARSAQKNLKSRPPAPTAGGALISVSKICGAEERTKKREREKEGKERKKKRGGQTKCEGCEADILLEFPFSVFLFAFVAGLVVKRPN